MKVPTPEGTPPMDVSIEELEALLEQARLALSEEGYQKLRAAIRTLGYVTELLEKNETTLAALRELWCSASSEKTDKVLKQAGIETGEKKPGPESASKKRKRAAPGHGRNGAAAYRGAQKIKIPHASLKGGDHVRMRSAAAKFTRSAIPACWCALRGRRPWRRPSMSWKS